MLCVCIIKSLTCNGNEGLTSSLNSASTVFPTQWACGVDLLTLQTGAISFALLPLHVSISSLFIGRVQAFTRHPVYIVYAVRYSVVQWLHPPFHTLQGKPDNITISFVFIALKMKIALEPSTLTALESNDILKQSK